MNYLKKLAILTAAAAFPAFAAAQEAFTLQNGNIRISVTPSGTISSLKNMHTGVDYAGDDYMWRLYYDTHAEKEIPVLAAENKPVVSKTGNTVTLDYADLTVRGEKVAIGLHLEVILEEDMVRFKSRIVNGQPGSIVRELHYPLVSNCQLPEEHKLLTTHTGGRLFSNPRETIMRMSNNPPYMMPSQHYRQFDNKYPYAISANCFAFVGADEGLYFGSHDPLFQDTWHGLRLYPDENREFNRLEAGFYKYPNCFCGEEWVCGANVVAPYSGSWHQTSKLYRAWADTWWDHRGAPMWVKKMKSWQRIIFKHQYGETFFTYKDLPGRIKTVGESVGADAVFPFGWWKSGMDNGNPDYSTDPAQGGDQGWKEAIAEYKKGGGKILMYFNGKLIDRESDFYKTGKGKEVCYHDNTGAEFTDQYIFPGLGTFTGAYNARTFVIADTRFPVWRQMLIDMADKAYELGANSVFYDQLGYAERSTTNWDVSREFPVPNMRVIADKAETLKIIREHIAAKDPEFALGTEWLTDATSQCVDYIHLCGNSTTPNSFIDWFRYTFPEVIISDRELRDDTDVERRVNNTILKGLRNDIEIYRCRGLIDDTPNYQRYLGLVNGLKEKYSDLLLAGTYRDTEGFDNDNAKVEARAYTNGKGMAIVVTNTHKTKETARIEVPGYKFKEASALSGAAVSTVGKKQQVSLGQHDLAVLVYEKK